MDQTFCQSCSMPLEGEELLGTEENGAKTEEYCVYCYEDGRFKQPGLSIEQMIEICVPHVVKGNSMSEEEARAMLNEFLPTLKRWKKGA